MTYKAALVSALFVLGLAGAEPALAQAYMDDLMPPGAVIRLLRVSGFEPMSRPVLQGRRWVVSAMDPVGTNVRIVVDAEVGEIISARPLDPHAPRYHPGSRVIVGPNGRSPRIANIPPGPEDVPPPSVPGTRPNVGAAPNPAAPGHVPSAARPATPSAPVQGRTPLPRSRPVESATISPEPGPDAKPGAGEPAKTAAPSGPAKAAAPSGEEAEHTAPVSTPGGTSGGGAAAPPGGAQPAAPGPGAPPSGKQTASAPPKPASASKPAAPVLPPVQALEE